MKTNLIKPLTILSVYLLLLGFNCSFLFTDYHFLYTDSYMPLTTTCEGFNPSDLNNDYWKIENIKTDTWHVLFHNVGVKYEIRRCPSDIDTTTSNFEFREIGPKYTGIHNGDFLLDVPTTQVFNYWAKNNQGYKYVENGNGAIYLVGSADNLYVFFNGDFNNIVDATMNHFNNIQRGNYHANLNNKINPNSHGRSTNKTNDIVSVDDKNISRSIIKNSVYGKQSKSQNSVILEHTRKLAKSRESSPSGSIESIDSKESEPHGQVNRNIRSPLDQFLIIDLFIIIIPLLASLYLSFTNIILYLSISSWIVITVYILSVYRIKIVVLKWYTVIKSIYHTVYNLVKSQIQSIKGINLLPLFFCLFVYILTNNLVGMVPYSFAPTSHFILTFFISFTIVLGCTILGFILHNLKFFSLLVPNGCPLGLLPLLVLIETVSYLARNVSLGLRLAANILSGHMLLNILSEFTYKIMDTNIIYFFIGIIPLIFIGGFSALELGIAFIQSQVFVVLSSSYTKDSLELH